MWEPLTHSRHEPSLYRKSTEPPKVASPTLSVEFKSEPLEGEDASPTRGVADPPAASGGYFCKCVGSSSFKEASRQAPSDSMHSKDGDRPSEPLGFMSYKNQPLPQTPVKGAGHGRQADGPLSPMYSAPLHAQQLAGVRRPSLNLQVQDARISKKLSRLLSATVNFRDVSFITRAEENPAAEGSTDVSEYTTLLTGVQKHKLIIILVGLPGRGKTFLCNKLMCYLNWLGHTTRHFNVGQYRRKLKVDLQVQDAHFFDKSNPAGLEARNKALHAALDDLVAWLESDDSQVAILDATNSTQERRQQLRERFHGRWEYLMIESVCDDEGVLRQNYLNKMKYSPDYAGVDMEQALADFKARIKNYEEVYETITDRSFHYIKLTDMVTGRGHLDLNRISGYLAGKLVQYLMQICKAGQEGSMRKIWLTRHGQSEFNRLELLGGDSSISEDGERYASLLPACLLSRLPKDEPVSLSVWTSTLRRTIQTARKLPFPKLQWKALDEIDAGQCDGMTYEQIAREMPDEYAARKRNKLAYRYPAGESYLDVVQRLEPVIMEVERERESVCIVSHQAVLRVLYGYFMGVAQEKIPTLEIPLHTLIELTPMPDGTMQERRISVNIHAGPEQFEPSLSEDMEDTTTTTSSCPAPSPELAAALQPPQLMELQAEGAACSLLGASLGASLKGAAMQEDEEEASPSSSASATSLCALRS